MIKIKICNPVKDRNEVIFRPFSFIQNQLRDYSIELTNSDDFDFLFIGMSDFWDMSLTLKDSVDWGLSNIETKSEGGDYIIFDGQDSTTLMGTFDVFSQSNEYDSCYIQHFPEGTMINVFFDTHIDDWQITTRSTIGAKCNFNMDSNITYRYMFLDALNEMNIDLNDFDKNFCYSFIF